MSSLVQAAGEAFKPFFAPVKILPAANDDRFGIDKTLLLDLVSKSFSAGNIDLYQAALLLEINCNKPREPLDHPLRLIQLHNDDAVDFSHKTGVLLNSIIDWGYTFEEIRDSGILRKSNMSQEQYTYDDITKDNGIKISQPQAMHTNGVARPEVVEKRGPFLADKYTPTFSAIDRDVFVELLHKAMKPGHERLNYMQATMMLAVNCHSLEIRKETKGRYIDHCFAVANDPTLTKDQRFIALIHDVVENTNITIADLKYIGLPDFIVAAVDAITIRENEKEKYTHLSMDQLYHLATEDPLTTNGYYGFIQRCAKNFHAAAVKMADIRHNLLDPKPGKAPIYNVALAYLEAVQTGAMIIGNDGKEKRVTHKMSVAEWAGYQQDQSIKDDFEYAMQRKHGKVLNELKTRSEKTLQEGVPPTSLIQGMQAGPPKFIDTRPPVAKHMDMGAPGAEPSVS